MLYHHKNLKHLKVLTTYKFLLLNPQRRSHKRESFNGVKYDKLGDHEQAKMPQESQRSKKRKMSPDESELNVETMLEEENDDDEETRFIASSSSKKNQQFYFKSSERT